MQQLKHIIFQNLLNEPRRTTEQQTVYDSVHGHDGTIHAHPH